jgi:hypothetical protein
MFKKKIEEQVIQKKTLKDQVIDLLKNESCRSCKYFCSSFDTTRKTEFNVCTFDAKNGCILDPEKMIKCENYEKGIRVAQITIRADDGNKIISKLDLVHLYDNKEVRFLLQQEGNDLRSGGPGIISYHMRLQMDRE